MFCNHFKTLFVCQIYCHNFVWKWLINIIYSIFLFYTFSIFRAHDFNSDWSRLILLLLFIHYYVLPLSYFLGLEILAEKGTFCDLLKLFETMKWKNNLMWLKSWNENVAHLLQQVIWFLKMFLRCLQKVNLFSFFRLVAAEQQVHSDSRWVLRWHFRGASSVAGFCLDFRFPSWWIPAWWQGGYKRCIWVTLHKAKLSNSYLCFQLVSKKPQGKKSFFCFFFTTLFATLHRKLN